MSELRQLQLIIELHGIIFSVFMIIAMVFEKFKSHSHRRTLMWALAVNVNILLADMLSVVFDGNREIYGIVLNRIVNYALYLTQYFLIVIISVYIYRVIRPHVDEVRKEWVIAVHLVCSFASLALVINIFTGSFFYFDSCNVYQRGPYYLIAIGAGVVGMIIEIGAVIAYRKKLTRKEFFILAAYFVCPSIGLVLQSWIKGFSFQNIGVTISVFGIIVGYAFDVIKTKERQKQILLQSQAYLLNSQIQPHFIFNCLNTIQSLIQDDPDLAEDAVQHFSKYLRKGLNLRTNESLISIWEEMEYVNHYLYMEKLRFGDKLQVKYSMDKTIDFDIPFLTLQPLVENAVRHGIRKKLEGGTILISIQPGQRWNTIQIIDDGVGMDVKKVMEKNTDPDSNGVGMQNVEERIRILCGGRLGCHSTIGKGTTVTIHIPRDNT